MLTFVFICNLLIALVNLYIAWRIWQLRRMLAKVAETLTSVERRIHSVLYPAPEVIVKGKKGTYSLRERYRKLELQLQKVEQILLILSLGSKIWQGEKKKAYPSRIEPRRKRKYNRERLLFP